VEERADEKLKRRDCWRKAEIGNFFVHSPVQQNGNNVRIRKNKSHSQSAFSNIFLR
jgi:hypothetical protein